MFVSVLKPVVSEPVVEPVEKKIIDWEASVVIVNLNQKNACYIKKEESQKKRVKWISKEELKKRMERKQYIWCGLLGYFIKICLYLLFQRSI